MTKIKKRFAVALSFPGERREFVEQTAEHLATYFTKERVLYDQYFEEEFARPDLDIYLPPLYRTDSELIVIFLSPEYQQKTWCLLEWRNIRQLIATADQARIMFVSFGDPGDASDIGILSRDGYLNIRERSPIEIAQLIIKRANLSSSSETRASNTSATLSETPYPSYNNTPIDQAPPLPPHFVSRPEIIIDLEELLLKNNPTHQGIQTSLTVFGQGGIGKSTTVADLTRTPRIKSMFPDGILWASLGQQPLILSQLNSWVKALGDYNWQPSSIDSTAFHLRTLLDQRQILLVVDDAWDLADIQPFLSAGANSYIVITTRDALIAKSTGGFLYNLGVMSEDEAASLITARLQYEISAGDKDNIKTLIGILGHLPLALELAAIQLNDGISSSELIASMNAEIARLEALDLPGANDVSDDMIKKSLSLRASLFLSLRRLSRDELDAFSWLGILPDDTTINTKMAATLWNCDEEKALLTLRYLCDKALLQRVSSFNHNTFRLHDLLHDQARRLIIAPGSSSGIDNLPGLSLTLQDGHRRFLGNYKKLLKKKKWHTVPEDGYIQENLTWHLNKAGWTDEIHALLAEEDHECRNGWFSVRSNAYQVSGFIEDVALAWQLAGKLPPDIRLKLQCRYALIMASLYNQHNYTDPGFLFTMVQKGVWSYDEARSYVSHIPDQEQRDRVWTGLLILERELPLAREKKTPIHQINALKTLVSKIPEQGKDGVLLEALEIVKSTDNIDEQKKSLQELLPILPESLLYVVSRIFGSDEQTLRYLNRNSENNIAPRNEEYDESLEDILEIASQAGGFLSEEDEEAVPVLIRAQGPEIDEDIQMLIVDSEEWTLYKDDATDIIKAAAPYLSKYPMEQLLKYSSLLSDNDTLKSIVPHVPDDIAPALIEKIGHISYKKHRAEALGIISPYLPINLLPEVLQLSMEIRDRESQQHTLTPFLILLAKAGRPEQTLEILPSTGISQVIIIENILPCLFEKTLIEKAIEEISGTSSHKVGWLLLEFIRRVPANLKRIEELLTSKVDNAVDWVHENKMRSIYNDGPHNISSACMELAGWIPILEQLNTMEARKSINKIYVSLEEHFKDVGSIVSKINTEALPGEFPLELSEVFKSDQAKQDFCKTLDSELFDITSKGREIVLKKLEMRAPEIAAIGGCDTIVDIIHSIQKIGKWWP